VRWRMGSDSFVGGEGWYVDDVTVTNNDGEPVSVPVGPAPGLALGNAVPNPTAGRASIGYALPSPQSIRLALYDVRGRLVRVLVDGARPAGPGVAEWDGRTEDGVAAAAGLYFYRLTAQASGERSGRLIVIQ
jgi:hypothetical protein